MRTLIARVCNRSGPESLAYASMYAYNVEQSTIERVHVCVHVCVCMHGCACVGMGMHVLACRVHVSVCGLG